MPRVFISYRRDDTAGHAGRLYDRLAARLGRDSVFRDIDQIAAGQDFVEAIRTNIERSEVMLVLIGPRWVGPRLHEPEDMVRFEVATALGRSGIRTIPVLLAGARMPNTKELPEDLAALALRNAVEVRDAHFDRDAAALVDQLGPGKASFKLPGGKLIIAAALMLVLGLGVYLYYRSTTTPQYALRQLRELAIPYNPSAFIEYGRRGDADIVKLFLQAGMDPNEAHPNVEDTAINKAAQAGHLPVVRLLLEHGARTKLALGYAAGSGKVEIVDCLLSHKLDKDAAGFAMNEAAERARTPMLQKLVDKGIGVDERWGYSTALMTASYYGHTETVRWLLQHGAKVAAVNGDGETALHYATRSPRRSSTVVRALVDAGADVNAANKDGATPLMNALDNPEIARYLIQKNANVNAKHKNGDTLLMIAAVSNFEVAEELLARGVDVNERNDSGETALMWASGAVDRVDRPKMIGLLRDHGARADLKDKRGNTALMHAIANRNADASEVLRSVNGKSDQRVRK